MGAEGAEIGALDRSLSESWDDDLVGAFAASESAGQAVAPITRLASATPLEGLFHADLFSGGGAAPTCSAPTVSASSAGSPDGSVKGFAGA